MKQQLKTNLAIEFLGIENWDDIATIEFAFAQFKNGAILKTATYPTNVTREGNVLFIPWTREDTAKFREGAAFVIDARPTAVNGQDLEVDPIQLVMKWTLFEE